jgi:hypothetical protein
LPPAKLISPRRWDIAVKWRYFRHLTLSEPILAGSEELGPHPLCDPDSERLYRWHIQARNGARMAAGLKTDKWKRTVDHYVSSAKALHNAMVHEGFRAEFAIPIDLEGELLGGAHRLACALALGMETVPVQMHQRFAWAPAWGEDDFRNAGMQPADLDRLREDFEAMRRDRFA